MKHNVETRARASKLALALVSLLWHLGLLGILALIRWWVWRTQNISIEQGKNWGFGQPHPQSGSRAGKRWVPQCVLGGNLDLKGGRIAGSAMGSIVFLPVTLPPEPFQHLMAFNGLLLPSVVAVMISMIGRAFLAANRQSPVEVPATGSCESWSEADTARIEHEIPRVKTEESDAMLGPASIASSGRANGTVMVCVQESIPSEIWLLASQEVHAPMDGLTGCKDPRSLETSMVPTKTDMDYWPPLYF
ncbi:hypothetical protein B0H10DRAFT_1944791 [Mycena sp. CBHHK59/15]|nr:hypothetical protein B0H10DRAFT_1944791 [Mycena sp. CBHHK59/15]